MKKLAALAAFTVVLVAGCSGEPQADDTETVSSAPASPASSSEAEITEVGATVSQWASEIASLQDSYDDATTKWENAICSATAIGSGAADCEALAVAMGFTAETIATKLNGLQNPDGPNYMGPVPKEIEGLVETTTRAASAASDSSVALSCPGDDCVSTVFDLTRDWDDLGEAFAGWAPYM